MKRKLKHLCIGLSTLILLVFIINLGIVASTDQYVLTQPPGASDYQTALVLGAYVRGDQLSPVLRDRVEAGIQLYKLKKVDSLLLSGDHGRKTYDEVNGMKHYVLSNNPEIPTSDVFLDHAGFDTYDSIYRAKAIFGVKKMVIVTQSFHIHRAVFIARSLGIDAVGIAVDEGHFPLTYKVSWHLREYTARCKALLDLLIQAKPKFLGPQIPIMGDGQRSWD